jgi:hypothetical protein
LVRGVRCTADRDGQPYLKETDERVGRAAAKERLGRQYFVVTGVL